MKRPEKCQNCGYSQRYSRQVDGEVLVYCADCRAWICAACREQRGCEANHTLVDQTVNVAQQSAVPQLDGIYAHIPEDVYHGDPRSLSSSGARALLPPSCPALFRQKIDEPPDPKPQYDFGHAAHKMVLGEGQRLFVLDPAVHGRTKDGEIAKVPAATSKWKAADQAARENGKLPITKANIDIAQRMAGVVHTNRVAASLLSAGAPEVSIYWRDEATGVRLRCRPDWLPDRSGRMICVDYKTAVSANPAAFMKAALDYGYHQQAAWYLDGLAAAGVADDAAFLFIVQQKAEPYLVSLVQLDPEAIELGRRQNRRAIELFAECQSRQVWPGYGDGIHTGSLPGWAVKQIEEALADA